MTTVAPPRLDPPEVARLRAALDTAEANLVEAEGNVVKLAEREHDVILQLEGAIRRVEIAEERATKALRELGRA